jgi:hypothetical protein
MGQFAMNTLMASSMVFQYFIYWLVTLSSSWSISFLKGMSLIHHFHLINLTTLCCKTFHNLNLRLLCTVYLHLHLHKPLLIRHCAPVRLPDKSQHEAAILALPDDMVRGLAILVPALTA